jgi:hypothetical protein
MAGEIENFRNTYASEDACAQVTVFRPEDVCSIFIRNVSLYLKVYYVVTPYKLFKFVLAIAVSLISVATQMFECCDIVFNCSFILYEYLLYTQKPVSVTLNCTIAPFVRFENKWAEFWRWRLWKEEMLTKLWRSLRVVGICSQAVGVVLMRLASIWLQSPWRCFHI